VVPDSSKEDFL